MQIDGFNYVKVAQNESGELFLLARESDIDANDTNGPAVILYPDGTTSKPRSLQIFYKFGVWLPIDEA